MIGGTPNFWDIVFFVLLLCLNIKCKNYFKEENARSNHKEYDLHTSTTYFKLPYSRCGMEYGFWSIII